MKLILKLALNAFTLAIVAYVVPGVFFVDLYALVVAAVIFGVVNTLIKPVLQIIFLPLTIITFGLTAFLINVVLLWGVAYIVPGFEIDGFVTALIASVVLMLVTITLHKLSEEKKDG